MFFRASLAWCLNPFQGQWSSAGVRAGGPPWSLWRGRLGGLGMYTRLCFCWMSRHICTDCCAAFRATNFGGLASFSSFSFEDLLASLCTGQLLAKVRLSPPLLMNFFTLIVQFMYLRVLEPHSEHFFFFFALAFWVTVIKVVHALTGRESLKFSLSWCYEPAKLVCIFFFYFFWQTGGQKTWHSCCDFIGNGSFGFVNHLFVQFFEDLS